MEYIRKQLSRAALWCRINHYLVASIACFIIAAILGSVIVIIN